MGRGGGAEVPGRKGEEACQRWCWKGRLAWRGRVGGLGQRVRLEGKW